MDDKDIAVQVRAASSPRHSKADIIGYFQQEYDGKWTSKLVDALLPIATDRNGNPFKRATLMRRFQGDRADKEKITPKSRAEYKALGDLLPPKPPAGGYHIEASVWIVISGDCPTDAEERHFTLNLTGDDADDLAAHPSWATILHYYFEGEDAAAFCEEAGESWAIIEGIEEEEEFEETYE